MRVQPDAEITLIKGYGGAFEVEVDGAQVFSKHALGRFPDDDEIRAFAGG